ncbi:MAG: isoamylase early set domain-containing protein [Spirochaetota bacterium]
MNCKEWLQQLKNWLEENWTTDDVEKSERKKLFGEEPLVLKSSGEKPPIGKHPGEKHALPGHLKEHAESCPKCSATLRGALMLVGGKELKKSPEAGLTYRVRERVSIEAEPRGWRVPWLNIQRLHIPKWIVVPVSAAVFAFGVILMVVVSGPNNNDTVKVSLFLKAPGASEIVVVGDWNGWDPLANRLTDNDGDGIWEIEIKLQRNREYRYQFLINGEIWVPDPTAPLQIEDGFGGKDSILHI